MQTVRQILSDAHLHASRCFACANRRGADYLRWLLKVAFALSACAETHSGVLGQNVALIDNILQELNPEQHAIGCIFVLEIKATNGAGAGAGAGQVNGVFLQQVKRVIMGGDAEQLRFVRRQVCDLCRIFAEHCRG